MNPADLRDLRAAITPDRTVHVAMFELIEDGDDERIYWECVIDGDKDIHHFEPAPDEANQTLVEYLAEGDYDALGIPQVRDYGLLQSSYFLNKLLISEPRLFLPAPGTRITVAFTYHGGQDYWGEYFEDVEILAWQEQPPHPKLVAAWLERMRDEAEAACAALVTAQGFCTANHCDHFKGVTVAAQMYGLCDAHTAERIKDDDGRRVDPLYDLRKQAVGSLTWGWISAGYRERMQAEARAATTADELNRIIREGQENGDSNYALWRAYQ